MDKLGNNTKTAKAPKGWENYIFHLSPVKKAYKVFRAHSHEVKKLVEKRIGRPTSYIEIDEFISKLNTCPFAGACAAYCLDTSGRGKFSNVQIARSAKTIHKAMDSDVFDLELVGEIQRKAAKAQREGKHIAIRLNGTSDLDFTKMVIQHFEKSYHLKNGDLVPGVMLYDYTKNRVRMQSYLDGLLPSNYYLTYSYDRKNDRKTDFVLNVLHNGGKVAIMQGDYNNLILKQDSLSSFDTIDGDAHDLRFMDGKIKRGAFVILQEKGDAKK